MSQLPKQKYLRKPVLHLVIILPANGSMFPQLNINRLQVEINNKGILYSIHDVTFIVLVLDS